MLLVALLAAQVGPWWYPTPDGSMYLSTARSIAGRARLSALGSAQLAYPPGYALLISPAFLTGERPFLAISALHFFLATLLLGGVYRWTSRWCSDAALLVTALVMVHVSLWVHYRRTLSELAFFTAFMWSVNLLDRVLASTSLRRALAAAAPASLLLALTCLIREAGIVLAAGFAAGVLRRSIHDQRGWAPGFLALAVIGAPALVGVAAFISYDEHAKTAAFVPVGTHLDGLRAAAAVWPEQTIEGLRMRASEIGRLVIPGMFKASGVRGHWLDINMAVYLPVVFALLTGWWRFARRHCEVLALTFPFYLAAYVLWPFDGGTRYLLPLLPLLFASVWMLLEPLPRYRLVVLALLVGGHLDVAAGYWLAIDAPRARACDEQWAAVDTLAEQIRPGAAVAAAAGVPECVRLMLEFALDRPVRTATDGGHGGANSEWLIMPRGNPRAGVVVRSGSAGYELLLRDSRS